jgi:hypothetical protein
MRQRKQVGGLPHQFVGGLEVTAGRG